MSSTVPFKTDLVVTGSQVYPGFGATQHAKGTLTSDQILALKATPQTLVAAPGAGKAIVFVKGTFLLDYNSAAYAGVAAGEDLAITYTDGDGEEVARLETTGFIDQTNDELRVVLAQSPAQDSATTIIPVANAALVISLLSDEITTGDSPIYYEIEYEVIETAIDGN